jgi:signal transduction histidine kinase
MTKLSNGSKAGMRSIRQEVLRAQLRPVMALSVALAVLISLLIIAQYGWVRLQQTNPLDEIETEPLKLMMRSATPEQWPVLARWIASYGMGLNVDEGKGIEPNHVQLPDGTVAPLSRVISLALAGQRIDVTNGQHLGRLPPLWQTAIAQLPEYGSHRLPPYAGKDSTSEPDWPVWLMRLDAERVVILSSPEYSLAGKELAQLVLSVFALVSIGVGVFMALFLFAFQRYFAGPGAESLSAPVQRLAAAVRLATTEQDATRRVSVEGPFEVAQLASDFNVMQEHLAHTWTAYQRVIDSQRELVTSLSHELRTPLTVLRGHAEVLERNAESAPAARIMLRQIEDLHRLLSDLLDMARMDSIETTLVFQDVLLFGVVDEMVERFSAAGWRQGVLVRLSPDSEPAVLAWADPRWLRQIVANLLSNAIRHTPQGGLVTLTACDREDHAQLRVEDTGVGLDAAPPRSDVTERTAGVGLQLARRLTRAMQGTLDLETSEHGGTRATLTLRSRPSHAKQNDVPGQ